MIDSSSDRQNQQRTNSNYSTNTITKRRHTNTVFPFSATSSRPDLDLIDMTGADVNFETKSRLNNNNDYDDRCDMPQQEDPHYEDILDVQVIAKMQEESLRQSVLSLNKSKSFRIFSFYVHIFSSD